MLTTFVVYVENVAGVLNRVASLFRRRGYNIESLTVGHTEKTRVSRMTIMVDTDAGSGIRLEANLYKLVNVLQVDNVTDAAAVVRDLAIIKVAATSESQARITQLAQVFRARILDVGVDSLIVEATGVEEEIDGLVEMLRPYGIIEMARTGRVAITCSSKRGARSSTGATDVWRNNEEGDRQISRSV